MTRGSCLEVKIPFDIEKIRKDFPVLSQTIKGKKLAYLDNGATTQKPTACLQAMDGFYHHAYGTVHRGVYQLSQNATDLYENSRRTIQNFLNASREEEIVFVRGTTEAINLVAHSFGEAFLEKGSEVIISEVEHHANIVPWQNLVERKGIVLKVIPVTDEGELNLEAFETLLSEKTKFVSLTHVSNALGSIFPIKQVIDKAHQAGAKVLIDGAQAVQHLTVDVQELDADFYCFSGHKIYGPTGIGILYGKYELLSQMPPYQFGGDMIEMVTFERTTYQKPPLKFEAGTPAFVEAIGLARSIEYLQSIDLQKVAQYENQLLEAATQRLQEIPGIRIIGTAKEKAAVLSFVMEGVHPHDIGTILDTEGVAVRVGHHCAQPTMKRFGVPATVRAVFSFYNTFEEIELLVKALYKVKEIFE